MMEPKIRLKGFCGEWEEKVISQVAPLQRGFDLPTHCVVEGDVPIAYSNGVLRYHNQGKCVAPAVVTGRSGTIGKFTYIESGKYWPHNTSLWVTNFFDNNPLFVYYLFHTMHFENYSSGSGVPTLNRNDIHSLKVNIPRQDEQKTLGAYFLHLDTLIQSTTKKIESLKQVKAASLQSMFPQEGETTPRVRFKGFEGEWEIKDFDYLFYKINDKSHNIPSNKYSKYGKYPIIDQSQDLIAGYTDLKSPIIPQNGIIIFGDHTREFKYVDFPFCTGADGTQLLSSKGDEYIVFLFYYCKKLNIPNTGYNRHFKYLKESMFLIPSYKEQQKIASYFTNLDSQITLQTQRLEKLKQIKSACLDNMFV